MIPASRATPLVVTLLLLGGPAPVLAQGVVRGAQEGAAVGNKAAGPVGGVVGGAVGGVFGGVAGGVKGVLGIPQSSTTTGAKRQTASRAGTLTGTGIRSELIGRPLTWRSDDGSQTGVTVFYTDNTAVLTNSSLSTGPDDAGRWAMRSNRICVTWEKINPGVENCSTWTRTGPKTFRDSDGITFTTN
jgi:hypothetical protein